LLIAARRFDFVQGQIVADEAGNWSFVLEAAKYFNRPFESAALLDGLHYEGEAVIEDLPYFDFQNRLAETVELLKQIGLWFLPHPWINLFLPSSAVDDYVSDVLVEFEPEDINGPILLYPFWSGRSKRAMLQLPDEPVVFILALLRTVIPPGPTVEEMLASNRDLFERARDVGGKQYPIGAIPFRRADWVEHFGDQWRKLVAAKRRYDPNGILTPGQGIFRPAE
jgi:cytokinin dehydrogenase